MFVGKLAYPETILFLGLLFSFFLKKYLPKQDAKNKSMMTWGILVLVFLYGSYFFSGLIFVDGDIVKTSHPNNFGDLPFHIAIIRKIAGGSDFWIGNPIFSGERLSYYLGMDFFASLFDQTGMDLSVILIVTGIIGLWILVFQLFEFGGLILILFFFFGDLLSLERFVFESSHWKSFFESLFLPQRGFLIGLPLGLYVIRGLKTLGKSSTEQSLLGFLLGSLVLFQTHSFVIVFGYVLFFVALNGKWERLKVFIFATFVFSGIGLFWVMGTHGSPLHFVAGWMNLGLNALYLLFLSLVLIFFLSLYSSYRLKRFDEMAFGFLVLIFFNFISLGYWEWDNIKCLMWGGVFLTRPIGEHFGGKLLEWGLLGVFFAVMGFKVSSLPEPVELYSLPELKASEVLLNEVRGDEVIAGAPSFRHPVSYFGRQLLMGYPGHLWSHGLKYEERLKDLEGILNGEEGWKKLAHRWNVKYIYWGEIEREKYPNSKKPWHKSCVKNQMVELCSLPGFP